MNRLDRSPLCRLLPEKRNERREALRKQHHDESYYPSHHCTEARDSVSRPLRSTEFAPKAASKTPNSLEVNNNSITNTTSHVGAPHSELSRTSEHPFEPLYPDISDGKEKRSLSAFDRLKQERNQSILLTPLRRSASRSSSSLRHPSDFILDTHTASNTHHLRHLKRPHTSDPSSSRPGSARRHYSDSAFPATQYQHDLFAQVRAYEGSARSLQYREFLDRTHKWSTLREWEDEQRKAASLQTARKRRDREERRAKAEASIAREAQVREDFESNEKRERLGFEAQERRLRNDLRQDDWLIRVSIAYGQRSQHMFSEESAIRYEACGHFIMDIEARYRNFIIKIASMARTQLLALEKTHRVAQLKHLHKLWSFTAKQEAELLGLAANERKVRAKIAEEESSRFSALEQEKIDLLSELARSLRRLHELQVARQKSIDEEHMRAREAISNEDSEYRNEIRSEEAAIRAIFKEQYVLQLAVAEHAFRTRVAEEARQWDEECARQQQPLIVGEEHGRRLCLLEEQNHYDDLFASHQEQWQVILKPLEVNLSLVATQLSLSNNKSRVAVSSAGLSGSGVTASFPHSLIDHWACPFQSVVFARKSSSALYPAGPCTLLRIEVMGVRGIHAGDEVDIPSQIPPDLGLPRPAKDKSLPKDQQWFVSGQRIVDGSGSVVCYFGSERTSGISQRGGSDEEALSNSMSSANLLLFWSEVACDNSTYVDAVKILNRLVSVVGFKCESSCTNVDLRELKLRVRALFSAALPSSSNNSRGSAARRRRSTSPNFRFSSSSGYGANTDELSNIADVNVTGRIHILAPVAYFAPEDHQFHVAPGWAFSSPSITSAPAMPILVTFSEAEVRNLKCDVHSLAEERIHEGFARVPSMPEAQSFDTCTFQNQLTFTDSIPYQGFKGAEGSRYSSFCPSFVDASSRGKVRVMPFRRALIEPGRSFSSFALTIRLGNIVGADDNMSFVNVTGGSGTVSETLASSFVAAEGVSSIGDQIGLVTFNYILKRNELTATALLQCQDKEGDFRETSSKILEVQGRLHPAFPVGSKEVVISGSNTPRIVVTHILRQLGVIIDTKSTRPRSIEASLTFSEAEQTSGSPVIHRTSSRTRTSLSGTPSGNVPASMRPVSLTSSTLLSAEIIPSLMACPSPPVAGGFLLSLPPETLRPRTFVDNRLYLPSWYAPRATVNRMQLFPGACVSVFKGRLRSLSLAIDEVPAQAAMPNSSAEFTPPCQIVLSIDQGASAEDRFSIDFANVSYEEPNYGAPVLSYCAPYPPHWRLAIDGSHVKYCSRRESDTHASSSLVTIGTISYSFARHCRLHPEVIITLKAAPSDVMSTILKAMVFTTRVSLTSSGALKVARLEIIPPLASQKRRSTSSASAQSTSFLPYNIPINIIAGGQRVRFTGLTREKASLSAAVPSGGHLSRVIGAIAAISAFTSTGQRRTTDTLGVSLPAIKLAKAVCPTEMTANESPAGIACEMEELRLDERVSVPLHVVVRRITVSLEEDRVSSSPLSGADSSSGDSCLDRDDVSGLRLVGEWLPINDEADTPTCVGFSKRMLRVDDRVLVARVRPNNIIFDVEHSHCDSNRKGHLKTHEQMVKEALKSIGYRHNFKSDVCLLKSLVIQFATQDRMIEESLIQIDVQPVFLPSYFIKMEERDSPSLDYTPGRGGTPLSCSSNPYESTEKSPGSSHIMSAGTSADQRVESADSAPFIAPSRSGLRMTYVGTSMSHADHGGVMRLFPQGVVADEDTTACGNGFFTLEAFEGVRAGDRFTLLESCGVLVEQAIMGGDEDVAESNLQSSTTKLFIKDAVTSSLLGVCIGAESHVLPGQSVEACTADEASRIQGSVQTDTLRLTIEIPDNTPLADCTRILRSFAFTREDPHGYVEPHSIQCILRFNARDEIVSDTRFAFTIDVQSPPLYTLPVERTVRTGLHANLLRPLAHLRMTIPGYRSIGTSLVVSCDQHACAVYMDCPCVSSQGVQSGTQQKRRNSDNSPNLPDLVVDPLSRNIVCNFALASRLSGISTLRPTPGVDGVVLGRLLTPLAQSSATRSRPLSALRESSRLLPVTEGGGSRSSLVGIPNPSNTLEIAFEPAMPCSLLRVVLQHICVDVGHCQSNLSLSLLWGLHDFGKQTALRGSTLSETFMTRIVCDVEGEATGVRVVQPSDRFVAFDGVQVHAFEGILLAKAGDADDDTATCTGESRVDMSTDQHLVTGISVEVIGARCSDTIMFPDPHDARISAIFSATPTAIGGTPVPSTGPNTPVNHRRSISKRNFRNRENGSLSLSLKSPSAACMEGSGSDFGASVPEANTTVYSFETKVGWKFAIALATPQSLATVSSMLQLVTYSGESRLTGPVRLLQLTVVLSSGRVVTRQTQVSLRPRALLVSRRPRAMPASVGEFMPILAGVFAADPKLLSSSSFDFNLISAPFAKGRCFDRFAVLVPEGLLVNFVTNTVHLGVQDAGIGDFPTSFAERAADSEKPRQMGPPLAVISAFSDRELRLTLTGAGALTITTLTSLLESVVLIYSEDRASLLYLDAITSAEPVSVNKGSGVIESPPAKLRSRGMSLSTGNHTKAALVSEVKVQVAWVCEVDRNSAFSSGKLIRDQCVLSFK